MKNLVWSTQKRLVKDLIPYDKNPRTLSETQKEHLTESFKRFNYVELIAINLDGTVISGHQRLKILKLLGRTDEEIEVRVPSRLLNKTELEEYLLRSNQNTGSWNNELLKEFDLDLLLDIGFGQNELSDIWDNQISLEDLDIKPQQEEQAKHTKIKTGDLFKLGNHYLLCGDSTEETDVLKVTNGEKMDMILSDPPYGICMDYDKGISGKSQYGGHFNDNLSSDEYEKFLTKAISTSLKITKPDVHIFIWNDQRNVGLVQTIYKNLGISYKRTCVWIKNGINCTPKSGFNKCYEPVIYGTLGKPYLSDKHKNFHEILNPMLELVMLPFLTLKI
ncbi:MAG: DNA methyltransferase [Candidatus Doudnabacteria bacterium]